MDYYAGIDVSLEESSVCIVDATGKIVREGKVATEPRALIAWFSTVKLKLVRVGVEAGPLSQWLYPELRKLVLRLSYLRRVTCAPHSKRWQ